MRKNSRTEPGDSDDDVTSYLYHFAARSYRCNSGTRGEMEWYEGTQHIMQHHSPLDSDTLYWRWQEDLDPVIRADLERFNILCGPSPAPASERDAVPLCNLSKGEYVRRDGLTVPHSGLAQALLSHICWSEDESCSMSLRKETLEKLIHGRWAGDRFCITTLEALPDAPKGREWADVTEEVDAI
ncbi:hypothetical protein C8T65DRAFT_690541, partial [Cerioporus squamosus]